MAIDSSLYGIELPIGTYTAGDIIPLKNIRGPAVVRDGYGAARLKRVVCGLTRGHSGALVVGHTVVKNSNWVDEIANTAAPVAAVSLSDNSNNVQRGHDCDLVPNSSWNVYFVVDETVTTTQDNDIFAIIDIDYPSVAAVQDPRMAKGTPCSTIRHDSVTINAFNTITTASWTSYNVDIFKAGMRYLLVSMGCYAPSGSMGFVSISSAAGQHGLERIIPTVPMSTGSLRYAIDYSTPLVKGPMNINYLLFGNAGTVTSLMELDWVKA